MNIYICIYEYIYIWIYIYICIYIIHMKHVWYGMLYITVDISTSLQGPHIPISGRLGGWTKHGLYDFCDAERNVVISFLGEASGRQIQQDHEDTGGFLKWKIQYVLILFNTISWASDLDSGVPPKRKPPYWSNQKSHQKTVWMEKTSVRIRRYLYVSSQHLTDWNLDLWWRRQRCCRCCQRAHIGMINWGCWRKVSEERLHLQKAVVSVFEMPSGNLLHSYGKWPIEIVDLPIKDGDFPWLC